MILGSSGINCGSCSVARARPSPAGVAGITVGNDPVCSNVRVGTVMGRERLAGLLALALLAGARALAAQPQPTGLQALHRSGQTFLTWQERGDLAGERYRVYRHSAAITAATRGAATLLAEVWEGSGRFFADRYNVGGSGTWRARYLDRFVITDLGPQLAPGTGLLVWTLASSDLDGASSGSGYYAVTTVSPAGGENVADFSAANAVGPIAEHVTDPLPVEAGVAGNAGGHVCVQSMDLALWNPTFHAPHAGNQFFGLDPAEPAVAHSLQYAYTYAVGEPDAGACGGAVPAVVPLVVNLHGWGGNAYGPALGPAAYYCAFELRPVDVSETWWFGFARALDYRAGQEPQPGDAVANFTEQRVVRMVYDLLRHPTLGPRIDRERIYVYGHSMGGSGALAFALRYPEIFAAAYASEPMTDYRTSGDGGGIDWRGDVTPKWGSPALNLPVALAGPGGWADHLASHNGAGVWDWQNHQANLVARAGDEMVPFGVAHGRADDVIEWPTQGRPAYAALDGSRRAWGGRVTDAGHSWQGYAGLPPTLAPDGSLVPFAGFGARLHETVPGLSGASGNPALPPADAGPELGYNQTIAWSASWDPWDGAPVDGEHEWRMSLRTTDGSTQSVAVTPRRAQHFRPGAGAAVDWENRRVSDGAVVGSGSVVVDPSGLVTVAGVAVTAGGNRLSLRAAAAPPRAWLDTTRGIHVFNDQLPAGMSDALVRFCATHYAGTQKMTRAEADRLRAVNPAFLILHYRLGHGLGYRAVSGDCQPSGDWLRVVEGDDWVQEWPGDAAVQESWLSHWPESGGSRVLNCDWGWYLAELDDPGWRAYWQGEVLRQIHANDDDGVFMDSLSVPSYLGADRYSPPLLAVDAAFEAAWARRIADWLAWLRGQAAGNYYLVPNVGSWITTRETTDYSAADGVMVEGFALEGDGSPYALDDWRLQMNRVLAAVRRGQALLAQTYVSGWPDRAFALASYLLVKGGRSFFNIDTGLDPEWWPEYGIPIGAPLAAPVAEVELLDPDGDGVLRRDFDNGLVLVNPSNPWDGSAVTRTIDLGGTFYLAQTNGGGAVAADGTTNGSVSYARVRAVTLGPSSAAVLLSRPPARTPRRRLR